VALVQQKEAKLQKCASFAPALVSRCIQLGLISANEKQAAESMFADPGQMVEVFGNVLDKYEEEKVAHTKLAHTTLGHPESSTSGAGRATESNFVGAFGVKSAADDDFREAIMGNV
jgi:hypothetical protein